MGIPFCFRGFNTYSFPWRYLQGREYRWAGTCLHAISKVMEGGLIAEVAFEHGPERPAGCWEAASGQRAQPPGPLLHVERGWLWSTVRRGGGDRSERLTGLLDSLAGT